MCLLIIAWYIFPFTYCCGCIPQTAIHFILTFIQIKIFSNFPHDLPLDPYMDSSEVCWFIANIWGFSRYFSLVDFSFNSIMIRKFTLYDFNYFKVLPVCFMAQTIVYRSECYSCNWKACILLLLGLCCASSLSHVLLFTTPWTAACQAPPSMGFARQEYWSGMPLPFPPYLPTTF